MNTTEINGFTVDQFNQYDLKVGSRESTCPLCSSHRSSRNQKTKCASLDWERGLGTCHHCDEVFQLHTFIRSGGNKEYVLPEWKNNTDLSDNAIQWFESRGISQSTLKKMKISEGKEWMPQEGKTVNTIQFNYFINGQLINTKYRDGKKNFKLVKGAEKVFYNLDNIINSDVIYIVEGEMDALSLIEVGIVNVVSVPNGATLNRLNLDYLDNTIEYFENAARIIIATDNDEAGHNLQQEFVRRFGAEACYTVDWGEHKDANDCLVHGSRNLLTSTLLGAVPVPLENVITLNDIRDDLTEFMEEGFKPGFQIGLPNFDSVFSTYTSQFITVTGIPSSGKSDFVDQMTIGYNLNYGWKTAYASPENQPLFLHAHKLIRKYWKGMPSKEDMATEKWQQITDHINDNFYWIEKDRYDLDSVLEKAAELVKRKGIRCLVIDPYNKVKMKSKRELSINDYTMEYLTKIDLFAKKYDCLVILVAHPVKMNKLPDGTIDVPTMYNVKGGGEFYDASYHGLVVHRNYEQKTVMVKVLKIKFQNLGENGAETHYKWNHQSGIYEPHEPQVIDQVPW